MQVIKRISFCMSFQIYFYNYLRSSGSKLLLQCLIIFNFLFVSIKSCIQKFQVHTGMYLFYNTLHFILLFHSSNIFVRTYLRSSIYKTIFKSFNLKFWMSFYCLWLISLSFPFNYLLRHSRLYSLVGDHLRFYSYQLSLHHDKAWLFCILPFSKTGNWKLFTPVFYVCQVQ